MTSLLLEWDGDGHDDIGVRRNASPWAQWYLKTDLVNDGQHDIYIEWGLNTDKPLSGDWNGDGTDNIGVRRDASPWSEWHQKYSHSGGAADNQFTYGQDIYQPLGGDWNGDGIDSPGVFRFAYPWAEWHLKNVNGPGGPDVPVFGYGVSTDTPFTGDWNEPLTGEPVRVDATFFAYAGERSGALR